MMTPDQAGTGLVALVGGGGISAVLVAFIGYLTAARSGRPKQDMAAISWEGSGPGKWDEPSAIALQSISTHMCRIAAILEIEADERWEGKDFRDKVNDRMLRFMVHDVKAKTE